MSYHWNDDAPEVVIIGDRKQRARKEHRCEVCPLDGPRELSVIPVGQEYRRIAGTQDGEFFVHRECVGGCPNGSACPACGGTGLDQAGEPWGDGCRTCHGYGRVRTPRAAITPTPAEPTDASAAQVGQPFRDGSKSPLHAEAETAGGER